MSISSTGYKAQYTSTGTTGPYPFSFPIIAGGIVVILTDTSGNEVVLDSGKYTVTYTNSDPLQGGSVTLNTAATIYYIVTILRDTPQTQEDEFYNGQPTLYSSMEDAVDQLTMEVQDLQGQLNRTPLLKESTSLPPQIMPDPTALAYLQWNPTGTGLQNAALTTTITTAGAAMLKYLSNYTSFAAALTAIGTSTATTLILDTAGAVSVNTTVPANIELIGTKMGGLTISASITLTILGTFRAGLYQVFAGSGTVSGIPVGCPEWWGAKGDGSTDDTAAIYAMFKSYPSRIVFRPGGKYYIASFLGTYAALELGSPTVGGAGPINLAIIGYGATLLQSHIGPFLGVYNANRVLIEGLKMIGYTGGTLSASRQGDSGINLCYNSTNVTIRDNYITNFLGDCIYAGGTFVSGGGTGAQTANLIITNNVLKERYGNGVRSYNGGSQSRDAIAIIDCIDAKIENNIIYGGIDCETNLDGQHVVDVVIKNNQFEAGNVTAQSSIGTAYNYDEPINSGGTAIPGWVQMVAQTGSAIFSGNSLLDNTFYDGLITQGNNNCFDRIAGNFFKTGQMIISNDSGVNSTQHIIVENNVALAPRTGATNFINIGGAIYFSVVKNNIASIPSGYVVQGVPWPTAALSTTDGGYCIFDGNINNAPANGAGAISNGTFPSTSIYRNNINLNSAWADNVLSNMPNPQPLWGPLVTINLASNYNSSLNYPTYEGNIWYPVLPAGANGTITLITNSPGDGFLLTITAGCNGIGTLTLKNNMSTSTNGAMQLKSGADAVMTVLGQTITLLSRADVWFEVSRNF